MKKRIIYLALVFLFIYFVLNNLNDGKQLFVLLFKAKWQFVLIALLLQMVHYYLYGMLYTKVFNLFDIKWKINKVIPLVLSSVSLNVFAPLAPFPGSSIFIQKARKEGLLSLNIAASVMLVILSDYLVLIPLLLISLYFQFLNDKLFSYEIVGLLIFFLIIGLLLFVLVFGIISPKILKWVFQLFEKFINGMHFAFKKRKYFIEGWHESRALQFINIAKKILTGKEGKNAILVTSLARYAIDISTFYLLFLAFGSVVPVSTLFVGYTLMVLFWIVSPTPQGVGVVETITPAIFASMGVNIETATLSTLAFRGLNLWLPVLVGFAFLHREFGRQD
jgi:glycosyltransferase 2 family protein